jgi:hypothetical protein
VDPLCIRKRELREEAVRKWGANIRPCIKPAFPDGFSEQGGKLIYWFDTEDRSTHVVSEYDLPEVIYA